MRSDEVIECDDVEAARIYCNYLLSPGEFIMFRKLTIISALAATMLTSACGGVDPQTEEAQLQETQDELHGFGGWQIKNRYENACIKVYSRNTGATATLGPCNGSRFGRWKLIRNRNMTVGNPQIYVPGIGNFYRLKNVYSELCLTQAGNDLVMEGCGNPPAFARQSFYFEKPIHAIQKFGRISMSLRSPGGFDASVDDCIRGYRNGGDNLYLSDCRNTSTRQWDLY
jgi:hypothetical protein